MREAMQQALECLKNGNRSWEAMEILEAAIAQPPAPEQASGYAIAMAVLQSDLYHRLDDLARAQCDAMLSASPAAPDGAKQDEHSVRRLAMSVKYPCGCEASAGSPKYCPKHASFMPLVREYADFMYTAGYNGGRPNGDYSEEAEDFERRIAEAAKPEHPQPQAQGEPEVVAYGAITDYGTYEVSRNKICMGNDELITLQSHREAIAQHRAALEECVGGLELGRDYANEARDEHARAFGDHPATQAELDLIDAHRKQIDVAITHANQVLEGGGK